MAGTQWPIKTSELGDLILDPRNVRVRAGQGDGLMGAGRDVADAAIAKYMAEAEDLITLVRDILRDGYLDNEIPVVVREDGGLVVLEGNRRVTALKVIANPDLLGHAAKRVERWTSRYPDHGSPTAIRVMVAPSREAAQPLLARLHTSSPKKSWILEQQAIFYHAQLADGTSVDELKVTYPTEDKISRFIQMGEMRNLIRGMHYDDPALREFVMNSELKMSTFEYAYRAHVGGGWCRRLSKVGRGERSTQPRHLPPKTLGVTHRRVQSRRDRRDPRRPGRHGPAEPQ